MHRIFVLDTNVLISAQIKEGSVSALAFDRAFETGLIVCTSKILLEFATRFSKKKFDKYMPAEDRAEAIARAKQAFTFIEPAIEIKACRDPDDDMFLSLAVATNASCIVTGDGALQELHPFRGIPILSPADFLKMF